VTHPESGSNIQGISRKLINPSELYGREKAMGQLLEGFNRACRGYGELTLVPGKSGVGKTSLVQTLRQPVESRNGWFVQGKFNQYQQNTPYSAIKQALGSLFGKMCKSSGQSPANFSAQVMEKMGGLGYLLVELVPELSSYLSADAPEEGINPQEARHRFAKVIRLFLELACQPNHPVVMFVDDWQWADLASMELLRQLEVSSALGYFQLIAAYRDEEVGATHPFTVTLTDLGRQSVPPGIVPVRKLTLAEVQAVVQDTLESKVADLEGLTGLVYGHTEGNPFFLKSFLQFLCHESFLRFEDSKSCWVFDVADQDLPEDIVSLFARVLMEFPQDTRLLLSLAACLGNSFDLKMVPKVSEWSLADCQRLLGPVFDRGLLLPDPIGTGPNQDQQRLRFQHDRVQQAAFLLIAQEDLARIRLRIGRRLLANLRETELAENLFEVLEHLNGGGNLIDDPAEQFHMVELNMNAAAKARSATAFGAMLEFYRAASRFVEAIPGGSRGFWAGNFEQALKLFRGLAEAEFLEGDRSLAEKIIQDSLQFTPTAVERAETLSILIVHFTLLARYSEAISAGRQALAEFDITLPEDSYEEARDAEIAEVRRNLGSRKVLDLLDSPVMSDQAMITASRLMITMGPPCYRTHQRLWSVLVPKVVNLTLRYGLIPQIGYSHTAMGGLLAWVANDLPAAHDFGELATRVMAEKFDSPSDQSVYYLMVGSSTTHWFKHLREASKDYQKAYEIGARSGNLQYAAYAFGHNMYCSFFQATPLDVLVRETEQSLVFSKSRLNHWAIDLLEGGLRVFRDLAGLQTTRQEEESYLERVAGHSNIQVLCIFHALQAFSRLIEGDFRQALLHSDKAQELIFTVGTQGLLPWPEHVFTRLLIMVQLYPDIPDQKKQSWSEELEQSCAQLQTWAECNPANYSHKHLLASAEMARITGDAAAAAQHYDLAIRAARQEEFLQWEAVANERASQFWQVCGNDRLAQIYWEQAYNAYRRWGAGAKLRSMEDQFKAQLMDWLSQGALSELGGEEEPILGADGNTFIDNCIGLLREQSADRLKAQRSGHISREAEELAKATERLRMEIVERKLAEEENRALEGQLRQSQKMQAVGTLAGGIAHEFNNLLTVILGCAEMARFDVPPGSSVDQHLAKVESVADRMGGLVRKILTFSRNSQQKRELCDPRHLVMESLSLVRPSIPASITIRENLSSQCGQIMVDRTEIHQVVMNLFSNASWAMNESGHLTIDLVPVDLDTGLAPSVKGLPVGQYARLSFRDTGRGMDEKTSARVFEPFFTGKEVGEGTGMGLAIVYSIMESYGGTITLETEMGQGTVFHLYFPISGDQEGVVADAKEEIPGGKERVLVVDDEEIVAKIVSTMMSRLGYSVDMWTSSTGALEAFKSRPTAYDLVFTDQIMPKLSGAELVGEIKKIRPDIPTILCTGYSSQIDGTKAAGLGINGFAYKPIAIGELARLTRKVLDEVAQS
jgi:predicted ATPase/signal transduction histidine kinase/CheY-like chemotaxis protein